MPCTDAHLKIERAKEYIRNIETRIVALHKTNTSRIEIHPQFGTERLIHEFTDETAFPDLALILGDVIHNLNCALDYTWAYTASRMIPGFGDRTKFPVRKTREEFEGLITKARKDRKPTIRDLCPVLSDFLLHDIRPYSGGNHAIWPIHDLSNIDKHRLLIPVLSSVYIEGISAIDENGKTWPGFGTSGPMKPPYVIDLPIGEHFKDKGKLTASIIVMDGASYHLRIPHTLVHYSGLIIQVVEAFEAFVQTMP